MIKQIPKLGGFSSPQVMPKHRVGRRWMFKQDEVDVWVRSWGAAKKSDKPDIEQ